MNRVRPSRASPSIHTLLHCKGMLLENRSVKLYLERIRRCSAAGKNTDPIGIRDRQHLAPLLRLRRDTHDWNARVQCRDTQKYVTGGRCQRGY